MYSFAYVSLHEPGCTWPSGSTELLGIGVVSKTGISRIVYHWLHTFVLTRFTLAAELFTLRPITLLAISCSSKPAKGKATAHTAIATLLVPTTQAGCDDEDSTFIAQEV